MEFESESPAAQSMVTIWVPVAAHAHAEELRSDIVRLRDPARPDLRTALEASNIVHFASLSVVDAGDREADDPKQRSAPYLILELNVDGAQEQALEKVATATQKCLGPIFAKAAGDRNRPLYEIFKKNLLDFRTRPWGAIGLNFNGTPEFSVGDIERQAQLAALARGVIDCHMQEHAAYGNHAMQLLELVRGCIRHDQRCTTTFQNYGPAGKHLWQRGPEFADFLIRPSRRGLHISDWLPEGRWAAFTRFVRSRSFIRTALLFLGLVLICSAGIYLVFLQSLQANLETQIAGSLLGGLFTLVVFLFAAAAILGGLFLYRESKDIPDDREPELAHLQSIAKVENRPGYAQNHITTVTHLKSGWLRKLSLAGSLWGIGLLIKYFYRPGFVLNMGTIHYARWFRPPGTEKLVFLSNYDGSWESYLEDFVIKAHAGQSAAWSNGVGFPRTRFLILKGAEDGDRFKRWVRRQQVVTQFWYSRFPKLTTDQIRDNALIHDGLICARTETAARAWLDCFGSMPRPDYAIESTEVQSLVFRGMAELEACYYVALLLPDSAPGRRKWLRSIGFGDHSLPDPSGYAEESGQGARVFMALSAAGLAKLGLRDSEPDSGLTSFPGAFKMGMAGRHQVLGDVGTSSPRGWFWSDASVLKESDKESFCPATEAVLLIYGATEQQCDAVLLQHEKVLGQGAILHVVKTKSIRKPDGFDYEHFGFRDGISQPVIRGTERFSKGALPRDIVEPGEFILGYRNNQGYFPPSPIVLRETDAHDRLPSGSSVPQSRFPKFRADEAADIRDFGCNGTYVVFRQLQQDVSGFNDFVSSKAQELSDIPDLANTFGGNISRELVAAKLMGRWQDGTPLIDRPSESSRVSRRHKHDRPDNDFDYAIDDPQGLRCPFGAHIRRANPRGSLQPDDPDQQKVTNRHRLLRRGRPYGSPEGNEAKGLLFACVCADIERQFEFVQQSWLASPNFHGLVNEPDPITIPPNDSGKRVFTIPLSSGPLVLHDMRSFVSVRGGGYFFLPSRSALLYLADLQESL
jgi:Dyp-type peroxidase family